MAGEIDPDITCWKGRKEQKGRVDDEIEKVEEKKSR